ncbi:hypothetical protein DBR06_SOUSAS50410007, partial [Sousa chinensis]
CIHKVKYHCIYRLIHVTNSSNANTFLDLRSICIQRRNLSSVGNCD